MDQKTCPYERDRSLTPLAPDKRRSVVTKTIRQSEDEPKPRAGHGVGTTAKKHTSPVGKVDVQIVFSCKGLA
jgi:hypothetical protein